MSATLREGTQMPLPLVVGVGIVYSGCVSREVEVDGKPKRAAATELLPPVAQEAIRVALEQS